MPALSAKIGEILVKTTHSKDLDDALHKIISEYLELKLNTLQEIIEGFREKWDMNFEDFKERMKDGSLNKDIYSFEVEQDFWQWEEAETLKKHYEEIKSQWI
jgi:hypothetical protein